MVSVSIIIPIYNVEQYVRRCLESVMAQGRVGTDIECLIVDDCSPDCSMSIVRQMVDDYQGPIRFKIVRHEVNRGLSVARNTGIHHATGDFVFFVDSDDYLMPDCISYFLENLRQYPDVDIVMGNVKNCKGGDLLIHHIQEPWLIDDPDVFFLRMLRHQIYLYAWNKLIRRSVLTGNDVFFIDGILYEDQSWSYHLFSHISSVLLLPKVTYVYEYNQTSIVNTTFSLGKADKVLWSYTLSTRNMLDNPPDPKRYSRNMTVDYLLFMANFLMNGVDVLSQNQVSLDVAKDFRSVRINMVTRALRYGRLLLVCFFLLLFPPLSYLQKCRLFRRHYFDIEVFINRLCHLTDFMHSKYRL